MKRNERTVLGFGFQFAVAANDSFDFKGITNEKTNLSIVCIDFC